MSAGINRQQTPITSHWRLHGHFHYTFGEMHIKVGKKSRAVPLLLPTVEEKSREEWSPRVRHRRQGGERNDKLLLVHLAPWAAVLKFHAKSFQACKWRQNERSKHEQQTGDSSQLVWLWWRELLLSTKVKPRLYVEFFIRMFSEISPELWVGCV